MQEKEQEMTWRETVEYAICIFSVPAFALYWHFRGDIIKHELADIFGHSTPAATQKAPPPPEGASATRSPPMWAPGIAVPPATTHGSETPPPLLGEPAHQVYERLTSEEK